MSATPRSSVRIAVVGAAAAQGLDPDEPLLLGALDTHGASCARVDWHDSSVDWASFDIAVVRSAWDYHDRLDEFLAWTRRAAAATHLVNPARALEWSADKRYLAVLESEGIAIVPTTFVAPGESVPSAGDGVWVAKPSVGAGSNGAQRCEGDALAQHVAALHADAKTALVQPYVTNLDSYGERALCFVADADGTLAYSHTFSKGAILRSDDVERVGDLFASEEIDVAEPSAAEQDLAQRALAAPSVHELGPLGYARVDVAPMPDGPVVMELELLEPSLYLHVDSTAAARFATGLIATAQRVRR